MWKGLQAGLTPLKKDEEDRLKRVFDRIDKNADGVICLQDLSETMKAFHYEPKKGELEDMIWEVDESQDKNVSYLVRCACAAARQAWGRRRPATSETAKDTDSLTVGIQPHVSPNPTSRPAGPRAPKAVCRVRLYDERYEWRWCCGNG
jgi:hypothetical protein